MFRNIFFGITLPVLFLYTQVTFSEIYTWIDENGKKNFGDKIPEKFQDDGREVSLGNLNTMSAIEIKNKSILDSSENNKLYKKKSYKKKAYKKSSKDLCQDEMAEYERSVKCFDLCRNSNGSINRAKCPTCINVVRPSCNLNVR